MADDDSPKDPGKPVDPSVSSTAPAASAAPAAPAASAAAINPNAGWVNAAAARIPHAEPLLTECSFPAIKIDAKNLQQGLSVARDDHELAFDVLLDHTAVDWPEKSEFELIYHLFSTKTGRYLSVITNIPRANPIVTTAVGIWPVAELQEREVYDLFGVLYDGHPDLRRLFLDDDWQGFPLRKDYKDDFMLELVK